MERRSRPDPSRGSTAGGQTVEQLARILDPFGVAAAFGAVSQAWLAHPKELAQALGKLAAEFQALNLHALSRVVGIEDEDLVKSAPDDERFSDPAWTQLPAYSALKQYYLLFTRWLQDTLYRTPGVAARDKRRATFWARQWLDAIAPSNYFLTNPVAIRKFWESRGESLVKGLENWMSDAMTGDVAMVDRSSFLLGKNLATTPGAVVFRNELVEVIQYAPATEQVYAVPIVIVAPWINKYYVLDLNEKKSLVRYLVQQGFTVFITSWKNPGAELAEATFDDYMVKGVLQAIEVARSVCATPKVHGVGYCLGGTALAALMAWLNRKHPNQEEAPVAHWTLFASLVDFSRPGAIEVFIDQDSIAALEKMMEARGYLDGREMARTFRMLRPNSLIWHYVIHNYLYGETPPPFDVLYWNTDATRLPKAMHSFYLREFYLRNKLIEPDGVVLAGEAIDLKRIRQPLYMVGCEEDHIAPWKATFALCAKVAAPVRYALTTSGHILGIINAPVEPPRRAYWAGDATGASDPEEWLSRQQRTPGSWWQDWTAWLKERCGPLVAPPPLGRRPYRKLEAAPGSYVLER